MIRIAGFSGMAAGIALAVLVLGSFLFIDPNRSYVFGDVIENVQKAKSVIFTNKQKIGNQPEFEFIWYIHGDKFRIEMPDVMAQIVDLKQKKGIQLNMVKKTAKPITVGNNTAKAFANPLEQLYRIKPNAAKKIGRKKLGKSEVDVYRIESIDLLGLKGKGEMTLWVNPKTQLPVRIKISANTGFGAKDTDRPFDTHFLLENFSWHASLDESLFRLQIPDGYAKEKK